MAIIDPAYTLLLAAGLAVGVWRGFGTTAARVAAWTALVLTTGYLLLGVGVNRRAEALAAAQLRAEGVSEARVSAYPTLLQLPLRRLVARSGSEVRVGWVSVMAPGADRVGPVRGGPGPLVEAARRTWESEVLEWFAMGQTAARVVDADGSGRRDRRHPLRPARERPGMGSGVSACASTGKAGRWARESASTGGPGSGPGSSWPFCGTGPWGWARSEG